MADYRADAHEALRLQHDHGATYDTGWAVDGWWALRLDGTGEPVGPAATPDGLDAMIKADEAAWLNPA